MKTVLLCIACTFFCLTGKTQKITIQGKIADTDTVMVILAGMEKTDTIFSANGAFLFTKMQTYPQFYSLIFVKNKQSIEAIKEGNERKMRSREDAAYINFFLQDGSVRFYSSFSKISNTAPVISNHILQDKYISFSKRFHPLVRMARSIIDSSFTANRTMEEKKLFTSFYKRICEIENDVAEQFVQENTGNAVGAYILYRYCRLEDYKRLNKLYQSFNKNLFVIGYLQNIYKKITALSKLQPTEEAPDFSVITFDNKPISLSSLKGKYTVLDFWGSWCQPCIKGLPKMKEYHERYSDKVNFIGIACKDKKSSLKEIISKYQLNWPQVLNPEGNNDLAVKYNIEAYPTKVLIDSEGKLIGAFIGETESFYQKLDSLFAN